MLSYSVLLLDNLKVILAYCEIFWYNISESDTNQEQDC